MTFAAVARQRSATAIDGDNRQGNHLSEPKRCSDKPGHLIKSREPSCIFLVVCIQIFRDE